MHICRCCSCFCCVCVSATATAPPAGELFLYFLCVFYALLLRLLMNYAVTALPLHHAAQLRPVSLYLCRSFIVSVFVCVCAWRAFAFTQDSTRTVLSLPPSYCVCLRHKNRIFIAFQFVIVYHTNTETHAVRVIETETHRERRSDGDSYTSV